MLDTTNRKNDAELWSSSVVLFGLGSGLGLNAELWSSSLVLFGDQSNILFESSVANERAQIQLCALYFELWRKFL